MSPIIEQHRGQIVELCRRFHVRRLEVFGSAATGDFDPQRSDLDFLVEFEPLEPGPYAHNFLDLARALEALVERPVDLVVANPIRNPYLRRSVNATRRLIYAADRSQVPVGRD
jgi:uncharacterized protein